LTKEDIQRAIRLLRKQQLMPTDVQDALSLVTASGIRNSEIEIALYFSKNGNMAAAKLNAGRAADTLSRII